MTEGSSNGRSLTSRLKAIMYAMVAFGALALTALVIVVWNKPEDSTLFVAAITTICLPIFSGLLALAVQTIGRSVEETPAQVAERIEAERVAREVGRKEGVQQERERANP